MLWDDKRGAMSENCPPIIQQFIIDPAHIGDT
ncbi:MAG: hypothetical protein ACI9YO_001128 [Gammaproteobacteria bacterium]|jgi:hypothetical protein